MSELEFAVLILWFTAYYFIERCLRIILVAYHPSYYEKLRASRKDLVFFGIWMGLLISTVSTPYCVYGARNAWISWRHPPVDGQLDNEWLRDPYSKVCVASRAILWVSELNRLDMYGLYVVHHAGSIVSLLSFIYFKWPAVLMFTLYSTLVSEIPGDIVWMLSSYVDSADQVSSALMRFKYHLVRFNAFQYTLIRGMGIASVSWMLITNSPGLQGRSIPEQTYAYTVFGLYALFCASYVFRQRHSILTNSLKPTTKEKDTCQMTSRLAPHPPAGPEHKSFGTLEIRLGTYPTILIVPYGLFMGIGFAALVFVSLTIGAPSDQDREQLTYALNLCLISAVFFARVMSIFMEDGIARLVSMPLRTLFRPGFWLHGGLFGATFGALLSYKLGLIKNFPVFAGSLAVGLPLYETFSRIGCHTYGCCYGHVAYPPATVASSDRAAPPQLLWRIFPYPAVRYSHPTRYAATRINPKLLHEPLIPIQLISATLFLLLFLCVSLPLSYYTRVDIAGSVTLICHAATRLITERYRADYRGERRCKLSATGRMALVQATGAIIWLAKALMSDDGTSTSSLGWQRSSVKGRIRSSMLAASLGVVVYGVHVGEIGSWTGVKEESVHVVSGVPKKGG